MAIDYQQILLDMNRPHRRQGKSMKTVITALVLMTVIAVGTFSAFQYGVVDKAKDEAAELVNKALGNDDSQAQASTQKERADATVPLRAVPANRNTMESTVAAAQAEPTQSKQPTAPVAGGTVLRPPVSTPAQAQATASDPVLAQPVQQVASAFVPAAVTMAQATLAASNPNAAETPVARAVAHPAGPVAGTGLRPGNALSVTDVALPESARKMESRDQPSGQAPSPAQAQAQMQAIARQRSAQAQAAQAVAAQTRSDASSREDISAMTGPGRAAHPALSEAKQRIKAIDQLLSSNPPEALRRIEELQAMTLEPDDAAETGYRRGYVARLLRDETNAEKAWKETADKFPTLRGGRFSALAIADTWYHQYAGIRPQMSFWDDIQSMYSRTLGTDDAPFLPEQVKMQIKQKLNHLNNSLFFGSAPSKLARYHKVEPGELLSSIANKYRVDYESIARINGIDPNRIRAGMDLKLVVGTVEVVVRKNSASPDKQPTLTWYLDGRWIREYPCCVGEGVKTPPGTYTFTLKERFPSWTNPVNGQLLPNDHPENILGSRWMAMKGMDTQGLGIHGTTVDDSIPGYTSAGCVRLLNNDVEELFSFGRIGGKVVVLD